MSYKHVIDAYAWIEYFRASKSGEIAKVYIECERSATPTVVVSEISRKLLKEVKLQRDPSRKTQAAGVHKSNESDS